MSTAVLTGPLSAVPPPADIRQMIGIRAAEVSLLRRLLKVAESRERMLPAGLITEAAARGFKIVTADQLPLDGEEAGRG